jgi:hypothetical protein
MITTRTLGQQILDRLKKFTTDRDITLNDTILAVQQALADYTFKTNQNFGFDGSLYYIFENVPVVDGKLALPANPMSHSQALFISKGIADKPYTQLPHGFTGYKNLPAASIGGEIGYYLVGANVYFPESEFGLVPPSTVFVKMLCPIFDANSDFHMPIPGELQQNLIDICLQRFGVTDQIPADETKDDVDAKA